MKNKKWDEVFDKWEKMYDEVFDWIVAGNHINSESPNFELHEQAKSFADSKGWFRATTAQFSHQI